MTPPTDDTIRELRALLEKLPVIVYGFDWPKGKPLEAYPLTYVSRSAVLALLDTLSASRAAGLDVLSEAVLDDVFEEMAQRGWVLIPEGHGPATLRDVFVEAYARRYDRLSTAEPETP